LRAGRILAATATAKTTSARTTPAIATAFWIAAGALPAAPTTGISTSAASARARSFAVTHALQHFGACRFGRRLHDITARWFACAAPDGLAPHGDGFGAFAGFRAKTFQEFDFDVLLGEALDVLHEAFFVQTHQVHGCAIGPGSPGAANTVNIVFADVGNLVVHYVWQVINVDAPGCDVGCHQGSHIAVFEATKRLGARRLALVAM
jgi:hypothetical protein